MIETYIDLIDLIGPQVLVSFSLLFSIAGESGVFVV